MIRRAAMVIPLLLAGCAAEPPVPLPAGDDERPDILLISIDTLRADHLGCYGHGRDTSPFLDARAREGTLHEQAWAPSPWTLPSHATMLTGLYPSAHGAIEQEHGLDPDLPRLPVALRAAGYATAGVVTSIFVGGRYGLDLGFDHFEDFGLAAGTRGGLDVPDAGAVVDSALGWAQRQEAGRPQFLFLHLYDVHYPYDAPSPHDEFFDRPSTPGELEYENYFHYLRNPLDEAQLEHQRRQYDEEIRYVDGELRRLWEAWRAVRPNAIVVVTSDHGEEFGERGSWGHAHTLYPEQLHVPLIVWGEGVARQRVQQRAGLEDLAPTLAALGGAVLAAEGVDRSAQWTEGEVVAAGHVSARYAASSRFSTLVQRWHEPPHDLVVDLRAPRRELYDLARDPGARSDVSGEQLPRARALQQELYAWLGEPWELAVSGTVATDGALVVDGALRPTPAELPAGTRFAVFPADAGVELVGPVAAGPFRAIGGPRPAPGAPLRYLGNRLHSPPAQLSAEERERLRSLGYID